MAVWHSKNGGYEQTESHIFHILLKSFLVKFCILLLLLATCIVQFDQLLGAVRTPKVVQIDLSFFIPLGYPFNSISYWTTHHSLGKMGYKQNSRSKYMKIIQNKMEDSLRHASGPVHTTIPLHLYRYFKISMSMQEQGVLLPTLHFSSRTLGKLIYIINRLVNYKMVYAIKSK